MTVDGLTDEEYGRLWAAQNGVNRSPSKVATGKYLWYSARDNGYPDMHGALAVCLDVGDLFYPSEAAAYADLGRAVREIRREIPDVTVPADFSRSAAAPTVS